jgi:hypothetical protein
MPKHDPTDFDRVFGAVLDEVLKLLERLNIQYMLIGGLAVAIRAEPRATNGPGAVVRFVRTGSDGIERWVDVLCAGTPFEELALARALPERLLGRTLPVATVEDLVILKLLAGRPQDWADVDALLRENASRLDDDYIDAQAADWEIDDLVFRARRTAAR